MAGVNMIPSHTSNMRVLVAIAALFVALFGDAQSPSKPHVSGRSQQSSTAIIKKALNSVMLVTVFDSSETPLGQGSGFLVDSQGTLVTNYHVIKYASSAIAKSANGAFYKVNGVLAVDATNDLAVLSLDGSGFTFLKLGDSDAEQVGDKVIAIGSPLGLEASV